MERFFPVVPRGQSLTDVMGKSCSICVNDSAKDSSGDQRKSPPRTSDFQHRQQMVDSNPFKASRPADKGILGGTNSNEIVRTFSYSKQEVDQAKIRSLFAKYKDDSEDAILADGIEKFCQDLGVDPAEFIVLVIAWKFDASQMCRFTRKEFCGGFKDLRVDSIKGLQSKFPDLEEEVLKEIEKFKDLYRFAFKFGLDVEEGQRALPISMAVPLWKIAFSKNKPSFLERWFGYLEDRQVRGISRDTWNMFLNFTETIAADFSNYDDSEAWPSLFDDFVEYEREKAKETAVKEERQGLENGALKEEA